MTSTRVIGPFTVPAIGLGCMPLSGMPESKQWIINKRDKAIGVVHAALDAGVRLLDTADIYAPTWNSFRSLRLQLRGILQHHLLRFRFLGLHVKSQSWIP